MTLRGAAVSIAIVTAVIAAVLVAVTLVALLRPPVDDASIADVIAMLEVADTESGACTRAEEDAVRSNPDCADCLGSAPYSSCGAAAGCSTAIGVVAAGNCASCLDTATSAGRTLRFALAQCGVLTDLERADFENDARQLLLASANADERSVHNQIVLGEKDLADYKAAHPTSRSARSGPGSGPLAQSGERAATLVASGEGPYIALPVDAARVESWEAYVRCASVDEMHTDVYVRLDGHTATVVRAPCAGRVHLLLHTTGVGE